MQEIYSNKRQIRDEVYEQRRLMEIEKKQFADSYATEKSQKAHHLREEQERAKNKKLQMQQVKDKERKQRYLERITLEKTLT